MHSIHTTRAPRHVAVIMDGNGRWAVEKGLKRIEGHRAGVGATEEIITCAREIGVGYLTLYAFSTENWNRPKEEVVALMELLKEFLVKKKQKMLDNGICLNVIGDQTLLPSDVRDLVNRVMTATSVGKEMVLTLALSYSSRDEIVRAIRKIVDRAAALRDISPIDEATVESCLDTATMPHPDLIIRTGGEIRVSNFLLWQGAYAELVFDGCFWPDFTQERFLKCLDEYHRRERRFGRVGTGGNEP